ncbi:MAG: polysaccharide deacetylase family protein [Myxococcota bacterium]
MRLATLSVDLDELDCYAAIYGMEAPAEELAPVYERAVPRYEALLDELGIRATFFAIGRDLRRAPVAREAVRRLHKNGHELANHSLDHRYDFSRLSRAQIAREVRGGADVIEDACGARPVGFRAPGYTISDDVFDVLEAEGVLYDSSVFPCPAYYGVKTAAITAIGLRARTGSGAKSHSIVDTPNVLRAPADPYRVGRPYWTRGGGLIELPIGVTRGPRLPFIGTSVVLGSGASADMLARGMIGRPLVNFELHGVDLADRIDDPVGGLGQRLPELRRRAAHKANTIRTVVRRLQAAGYRFVTTADAARTFAAN